VNTRCYHVSLKYPCQLKSFLLPPNSLHKLLRKLSTEFPPETLPAVEDNLPNDEVVVDSKIDHESLLKNAEYEKVTVSKASESVILLAKLKRDSLVSENDYVSDERFLRLVKTLENPGTGKLAPLATISTLKSLVELNIPNDAFAVKNLENSLTWMARSCAIKDLVMMLSFSVGRRSTETQDKLFSEICRSLERRWVEIRDSGMLSRTFVGLLHYSEHFTDQFLCKLEDRLAEIADELNGTDLTAVLYELGRKRRRNVPLLKAISYYLGKNRSDLDIKQASDALFALKKLSFKDQEVLEKLCATIEEQMDFVENSAVVRSILTSLGQLHFLHTGVMEKVIEWYNARREQMDVKDMVAISMTCANLNYLPQDEQGLVQHIAENINENSLPDQQVWQDVVWSLVVLGRATHSQMSSVLNSEFQTSLLYSNEKRNLGSQLKLLNINAAATKLHQDYNGSLLNINEDALLKNLKVNPNLGKVKLQATILEAFSNLIPPPRFLRLSVNTLMGFVADGECVLDREMKPLLVDEYSNNFQNSEPKKPLPAGATRVALIVASFQDCNFGGGLGGVAALNVKLAEAAGYKVLVVKFSDMDPSMKLIRRVQILDKMLKDLLEKN